MRAKGIRDIEINKPVSTSQLASPGSTGCTLQGDHRVVFCPGDYHSSLPRHGTTLLRGARGRYLTLEAFQIVRWEQGEANTSTEVKMVQGDILNPRPRSV